MIIKVANYNKWIRFPYKIKIARRKYLTLAKIYIFGICFYNYFLFSFSRIIQWSGINNLNILKRPV